ncbi:MULTISPECIES: EAL domain-containing protein [Bosea]|uniref:EAL domain-containing protein n=1 Tax=Bosea TaxID=85413 RepID=UPI00214FA722|nr:MULTISPECIES: EAL domain-containing protein [Bosea]MCR4521248.1 EAL domain-containing protein [Bosea sp. 47.2.35]MDR6826672.1 cyclic-di-GMP phosphodiesterase TipF (flagellum assembly factor) [Bosea robiniae]MDR6893382.1 cyclic-di-GMP phosphodiesterase TipF (flagellum assembly factor) [Bosea sp. BE109]MDR7136919.1 cyclic-di-GMP phosphodiesterase TipF (flagellum assembly factor) [Bosea sp. BE168]MDR7173618.1 cyclic-di-GMP phosphodiesterase TipF (flagellum assembly factor) [Bosea sp. BE271]
MAPARLKTLHPLAGAVTGLSAGAAVAILLPGGLGSALGLLAAGAGFMLAMRAFERRGLARHEQAMAGIGEVKVRLATNAIRLDALSQRVEQMPMRDADAAPARAAIHELTAEVGLLGDLIHQVATTLADHETVLARMPEPAAAPLPAPAPEVVLDPEAIRRERAEKLAAERAAAAAAAREEAEAERAALIGKALSEGRLEVHLQPIVSLPQRRTCGYEALARLRLDENTLLLPHEFIETVETRGFGPTLDALVLTRALAIARHLGSKDGGIFVSCNFSRATWNSSRALAALTRILDKYRDHTAHLVIEMPQAVFRELDPTSLGLLGAMSANGVRFALDQLVDLRLDPSALFDRGIRYVKAPAALLQAHLDGRIQSDIAAGDLATLLARVSVTLVADQVEDNPAAADMIELGATMGQGLAFSPPRPVKPEVFAEPEPVSATPAPVPTAPAQAEATPAPQSIAERLLARASASPAPLPFPETAPQETRPERLPFRAVLRRASA